MSNSGTNEQIDLTGQVAIVTGGGRGIGRAMALALARAGAAVAVVARTGEQLAETVALIKQEGGRAGWAMLDISAKTGCPFVSARYRLSHACRARLAVYDAQGKLMELLAEGKAKAGLHGVSWGTQEKSPGMYRRLADHA